MGADAIGLVLSLRLCDRSRRCGPGQRDADDQRRQDEGAGRAAAVVLIGERDPVEIDQRRPRQPLVPARGRRAAQDVEELVERLKRRDEAQQEDGDGGVAQAGEGDVAEGVPARARAVHPRRLVEGARNLLQSRDEDDHVKADLEPQPDRDQHQPVPRRIGGADPDDAVPAEEIEQQLTEPEGQTWLSPRV